jgi:divalent metal cation (Fe/Co/Zn/Cd) transporter
VSEAIVRVASALPGVTAVNGVLTAQLSPSDVVAAVSVEFDPGLRIEAVEAIVTRMEEAARAERPEISSLFVKPQPQSVYQAARRRRSGA